MVYISLVAESMLHLRVQKREKTSLLFSGINMLARCYMTNGKRKSFFASYKSVTVCERRHNFQNFCNDLPSLHGYSKWRDNNAEYELDPIKE